MNMNTAKSLLALSRYQAKKESYEEEIRKLKDLVKKQDALLKKVLEKKELESDQSTKRADRTVIEERVPVSSISSFDI